MPDEIYLCVCENIEREARAVLALGDHDFEGVALVAFPGRCGRPPLAGEELQQLVPEGTVAAQIVGSACVSSLRRGASRSTPHGINHVAHCFHMFTDHVLIEKLLADGDYLLTPGWLAHWRERVARWGFNQDDLQGFLREAVVRLHLLDTSIDGESAERLREFAGYAQRAHATTWVGLDFFAHFLKTIVLRARLQLQSSHSTETTRQLRKRTADYAMAMDLLGQLAAKQDEGETIQQMLEVFTLLFAPRTLAYVTYEMGSPSSVYAMDGSVHAVDDPLRQRLALDASQREDSDCLCVSIEHAEQRFGVVLADQLAFPEYGSHYRALIDAISPICGLSMSNARSYQEVLRTGEALQLANQELSRLATIDGLTQLANRMHFDERLDTEWRRAKRQSARISLIMIDIDHFKLFNDHHGHQAGDRCLRDVALIVSSCLARAGDLAARYGGEEFAIILPSTALQGARVMANRIREAVAGSRIEHGASPVGPYVTLSVGFATMVPDLHSRAEDLVKAADNALYEAKRQGRNRCCEGAI